MTDPAPESFQHYSGKIVCIKTYIYRHEAEMARSALDSNGIDCYIAADDGGGMRPDQTFLMGVRLMVKEDDVENAVERLGRES